ncbi:PTS fructose transporter subunit IIABC [Spiroplasma chrysopicola]|uniref:PTS system fructose-specific IIA component n=1 Tax=Spiroplasma chrysopicola DF-1 TaxID=1276227 RepID=R4U120_9MOLU|nr:fructose PTS transporter subunit IIB [Spiroplasma chrysopicola]AGM25012.1 PTS system fructose-specific IIA component [Spiroplasma chrysopicola DF-1]
MENIINENYIFLNVDDVKDLDTLFNKYAKIAQEYGLVENYQKLVTGFKNREKISSTAFEDGFAIPHARIPEVKAPAIFYIRLKNKILWNALDSKDTKFIIMLIIPEGTGNYLDILSGIAKKLLKPDFRHLLETENDKAVIAKILSQQDEDQFVEHQTIKKDNKTINLVGVSACATGVVHTYMARDALLAAATELNWNLSCETQGQKGQEYPLTTEEIANADGVILATDISVEMDRFIGKKVYKVGTKQVIHNPQAELLNTLSKGKVLSKNEGEQNIFAVKNKKAWINHIMSGVSFMIPFIVFAGILFAIVTGIGKIIWGTWLDYSGTWDYNKVEYLQKNVTEIINGHEVVSDKIISGWGIGAMYLLNKFAGIGFTVMMPIMGAYIANSIAGRAAITPAFVLTFLGCTPDMWLHYAIFAEKANLMQGLGIFAALIFGFSVGYLVKWINTKWRIHRYIKPIMPIIIIPVFVSVIFGALWMFVIGNIFGLAIGYLYDGLNRLENSGVGMALVGLVLGILAGIDMGGPINKIASFSATALIFIDGGKSMGAAAASFAIAPLGCGITALIFRKRFRADKELAINASILGFMGISEGAIPFAVKYTWAAIIPNIIGSGVAAMCAGLFQVSGWVGAWGGPIIALFGGVTTWSMSYIGILWYLLAIAIGVVVHIIIFRILVEVQSKGKLTREDFKEMFQRKNHRQNRSKDSKKDSMTDFKKIVFPNHYLKFCYYNWIGNKN